MTRSLNEKAPADVVGRPAASIDLEERREHRRRPRAVYEVDGLMEVAGATKRGDGLTIRTKDVSDIGVALRCPESVSTGSPVRLTIVAPTGTPLNLRGLVVRLNPLPNGNYEVGVRFAEEQPQLSAWRVDMAMRGH